MPVPHIHLLCYHEPDRRAFQAAHDACPLPEPLSISYHTGSLKFLDPAIRFDAVVSPANSYGRMDGGSDDALPRAFSPAGSYLALTHTVQQRLYTEWRGFAPPGTCTLVPFNFTGAGSDEEKAPWGCRIVAVCPTMRQPEPIPWDREVVYECVWSLLCAVQRWNEGCSESDRIGSILMTPLATGTGGVSAKKWAVQTVLALKHFMEADREEAKWSQLDIFQIQDLSEEVAATHSM